MTGHVDPGPRSPGTVGWGILASGGIARVFTTDLLAHGHRVAAVGSRSEGAARTFAESFQIPHAHGSYEGLVADPTVDVVYVATPHNFHAANATLALEHGKHVLVEKAFTLTAGEARSVVDVARRHELLVMEAMWTRFLPHMAWVRSVVRSGRLGEVRSLHADHTQSLPRDVQHRINNARLGGGALLDLGVYPVSFAHDLFGPPLEVQAQATFKATGVDGSVATMFRHGGGEVSTTYSSSETRGQNTATVLGTEGRLEIASTWYAPTTVVMYDAEDRVVEEFAASVSGRGMQYQAAEVEHLLGEGGTASALMSPEESVDVMTTLDEIRRLIGMHYPD